MNKRKIIASVFSCISILGWMWIPAFAETMNNQTTEEISVSNTIVIGEIAWAGSSLSTADEWLELWNLSPEEKNIGGWILTGASSEPILFPATATIPGLGVFLISNYAQQEEKSVIATTSHLVTTALSLSNSALHLTLTHTNGTIIDTAGIGKTPLAGSSGKIPSAMLRDIQNNATSTWISAFETKNMKSSAPDLGTPGWCDRCTIQTIIVNNAIIENTVSTSSALAVEISPTISASIEEEEPTPIDIPPRPNYHLLRLNEIAPAPHTGKEWIELVSLDKEKDIPLTGYTLHDAKGRILHLTKGIITPQQHLVLELSRAVLANKGDTVSLYAPNESLIDTMQYTATKKGEAWVRLPDSSGDWFLNTDSSPGAINTLSVAPKTESAATTLSQEKIENATSTIEQTVSIQNTEIEDEEIKETQPTQSFITTSTTKQKVTQKPKKKKISATSLIHPITFNTFSTLDMDESIRVRLHGIVGTPVGLIKARSFILQSQDGRGLLVTATTERKLPTIGQPITLTGRLTTNDSGAILKLHKDDSWKLDSSTSYSTSTSRKVDLFIPSAQDIWSFIQATGTVQEIKGRKVLLNVDGAPIEINISNKISYRPQRLKKGDTLRIQGILAPSADTPRVFPRSSTDIEILQHALVVEATHENIQEHLPLGPWTPVGATAGAIGIVEGAKHIHRKRKEKNLEHKIKTSTK